MLNLNQIFEQENNREHYDDFVMCPHCGKNVSLMDLIVEKADVYESKIVTHHHCPRCGQDIAISSGPDPYDAPESL